MPKDYLLNPPVTFLIMLAVLGFLTYLFSKIAYKGKQTEESKKAYACGEEFTGHMIQPDYSQFFPFVFFFTILHVVALTIATVPMAATSAPSALTFSIAVIYVVGAMLGLFILLRR